MLKIVPQVLNKLNFTQVVEVLIIAVIDIIGLPMQIERLG